MKMNGLALVLGLGGGIAAGVLAWWLFEDMERKATVRLNAAKVAAGITT